jgi:hypothetical protein
MPFPKLIPPFQPKSFEHAGFSAQGSGLSMAQWRFDCTSPAYERLSSL